MTFMERVTPVVDDTIAALSHVKFVEDPIAGTRYSRATSIVSSAYKRHGRILEIALRESLRDSNRHMFDSADQSIRAYEIKRGNGQFDAGKIRSITRDLKCIQVLLKSYGEFCQLKPTAAESKIIFYYGIRSIPRPWSLVKGDLDEHFGFPVAEKIEQANEYFRTKLHALLDAA